VPALPAPERDGPMRNNRLVPLVLAVTGLLVVAGIASHGRPLAGGRGSGPTATFFDYVATTLVIVAVVMLGVLIWAVFSQRPGGWSPPQRRSYLMSSLVMLFSAAIVAYILSQTTFVQRLRELQEQMRNRTGTEQAQNPQPPGGENVRNPHIRWDEIGIVVALIAGTAVVLLATRHARRTPRPSRNRRSDLVSFALDESIDDLRNDPDVRRAIIAAYARMERALARAGLPRHPSEAPFEFLARALGSLDASAEAIEELTNHFEWAKFSQHEPSPSMRDEAIDALLAVRADLARPEPVGAGV
jgi:Domain of unknown function (DUF4129)